MKILFVSTIVGTVNSFLIPHIKLLINMGHQIGVASNTEDASVDQLKQIGCVVHHVSFSRNPMNKVNLKAYSQMKKLVKDEEYRLVHVHTPVAALVTRLACRHNSGVNLLYTAHGFHFYKGASLKNNLLFYYLEKIAARWTDGIITINQEDYESAKRLKLRKNNYYKINGVGLDLSKFFPKRSEMNKFRSQFKYQKEDFIIISVGELNMNKNQGLIIQSISMLKEKIPNLKLLLIGEGEQLQNYKELAKRLNIEEQVDFLGYRTDVEHLLTIANILISASRREGLPVNVMEAMASGVPVVVTDCRGNRDLIDDNVNGFVIGIDDVEGCARAIEELYYSKSLRHEFSVENLERIQSFSLEKVLNEMKAIYMKHISQTESQE